MAFDLISPNLIGHCLYDGSNKICVIGVRQVGKEFVVIYKWGRYRAGIKPKMLMKTVDRYSDSDSAMTCAKRLFQEKINNHGYVDIEATDYCEGVTRGLVSKYIEPTINVEYDIRRTDIKGTTVEEAMRAITEEEDRKFIETIDAIAGVESKIEEKITFIVMCINNKSIEHLFDNQEQYLAKNHPDDPGTYLVMDVYGNWQEVVPSRFAVVEEELIK